MTTVLVGIITFIIASLVGFFIGKTISKAQHQSLTSSLETQNSNFQNLK